MFIFRIRLSLLISDTDAGYGKILIMLNTQAQFGVVFRVGLNFCSGPGGSRSESWGTRSLPFLSSQGKKTNRKKKRTSRRISSSCVSDTSDVNTYPICYTFPLKFANICSRHRSRPVSASAAWSASQPSSQAAGTPTASKVAFAA